MRNGYFVEFGATDGITNSNTYLLERKYRWRGILAEPNPVWHSALNSARKCNIDHRCVSSSSGNSVKFLTTDDTDPELSSIAEFAHGDHFSDVRARGVAIKVETVSLNDLLEHYEAPFTIDYLSIDTEGSEFDILSHFDFSKHRFQMISVEQNPYTEKSIESLLATHGFVRVFKEFSQWDGWYIRQDSRNDALPTFG
jgi:FkbM family methyltransferase